MALENTKGWRVWLCVAGVIVLTCAAYVAVVLWNTPQTLQSGDVIRITTLGEHATPRSAWVESISVTEQEHERVLTIQERTVDAGDRSWNPLVQRDQFRRGLTTKVPRAETWAIEICDEPRTVTYRTSDYRWVYDHSDPKHTVTRDQRLTATESGAMEKNLLEKD